MVRFLLGDPSEDLISDEMLGQLLETRSNVYSAGSEAAKILSRKFAMKADKTSGSVRVNYQERARTWMQISEDLKRDAASNSTAKPYFGGISKSDKTRQQQDTDRTKPSFSKGMFDFNQGDNHGF